MLSGFPVTTISCDVEDGGDGLQIWKVSSGCIE
jgi:hypothetical protein